jgi:hypothetical protein
MYLIHKQGGYFNSISKMVEEVLGEPCKHTSNPNETGTWVLFFTSFLSGFYKAIKGDYIVIQTEPILKEPSIDIRNIKLCVKTQRKF